MELLYNDKKATAPKLILLDVYETMLDMSEVERKVNMLLKSKQGYIIWFELFMQYSFVDNSTVQFHDFESIADATLKMASQILKTNVHTEDIQDILELMKHLPLNENVQKGLSKLNDLNFRIAALTNSPKKIVIERMERTGLISYFEKVYSAEHVGKYKPAMEVYQWVIKDVDLSPQEILMVSAYGWDIAGGANAGLQTAFIAKNNQMLYPLAPAPNYISIDLVELSKQLQANGFNNHHTP